MAANPNSNSETWAEKEDEVIYDAEPIRCIFPYDNNDNINFDSGDDKNDSPKHYDDTAIITSPSKEISSPLGLSGGWINNWIVKETTRSDGKRIDRTYYHKEKMFTVRSKKTAEYYEKYGKLPERKSKETRVEEFLAEAHYNLLHWFDA